MSRDFLMGERPASAGPLGRDELAGLISDQTDVMADIRRELMKQNPEVLTTTVVRGGNAIMQADRCYEVWFELGGKPVPIYKLMAYSTIPDSAGAALTAMSVVSMGSFTDGIPVAYGDVMFSEVDVNSWYIWPTVAVNVNGPSNANPNADITGSMFLYGWTIPDYDRNKGNLR